MNTLMKGFHRRYISSDDAAREIADDLLAYCTELDLAADALAQVELCLIEIVNNAYEHAYKYQEECPIEIACYVNDDGELVIEVSDFGETMSDDDFSRATNADFIEPDPNDPETWTTSGRGFIIVVELTDNLEYTQTGPKNTFKLYKRLQHK